MSPLTDKFYWRKSTRACFSCFQLSIYRHMLINDEIIVES